MPDTTKTSPPICFIDTETDGVHPGREAWEIAIIRDDAEQGRTWSAFVDIDLSTADPFGLQVGGYYERHPTGRYLSGRDPVKTVPRGTELLTEAEAAVAVARLTHGAHIVGAVPNFDTEVLARLLRRHGLMPAWHYHLIDVENLAVGRLAALGDVPELPWDSDELTRQLGLPHVPEEDRHTALGDARWAQAVYWTCVAPNRFVGLSERPHPSAVIDRVRQHLEQSHQTISLPAPVEQAMVAAQREARSFNTADLGPGARS